MYLCGKIPLRKTLQTAITFFYPLHHTFRIPDLNIYIKTLLLTLHFCNLQLIYTCFDNLIRQNFTQDTSNILHPWGFAENTDDWRCQPENCHTCHPGKHHYEFNIIQIQLFAVM